MKFAEFAYLKQQKEPKKHRPFLNHLKNTALGGLAGGALIGGYGYIGSGKLLKANIDSLTSRGAGFGETLEEGTKRLKTERKVQAGATALGGAGLGLMGGSIYGSVYNSGYKKGSKNQAIKSYVDGYNYNESRKPINKLKRNYNNQLDKINNKFNLNDRLNKFKTKDKYNLV